MTKAEIITRIIDRIIDPWTDCPEDYEYAEPITLAEAEELLKHYRYEDSFDDLEPDEKMPEEATPALLMEAHNCNVRYKKRELRISRLAEYITDNEMVCEYTNFMDNPKEVFPVDWLYTEHFPFTLTDDAYANDMFLITLGQNSPDFNPDHEFCWYDKERHQLHSTDHPFGDGVLDADAFARVVMCDADALGYFLDGLMDDDDIRRVFGCTKHELLKEVTC